MHWRHELAAPPVVEEFGRRAVLVREVPLNMAASVSLVQLLGLGLQAGRLRDEMKNSEKRDRERERVREREREREKGREMYREGDR